MKLRHICQLSLSEKEEIIKHIDNIIYYLPKDKQGKIINEYPISETASFDNLIKYINQIAQEMCDEVMSGNNYGKCSV